MRAVTHRYTDVLDLVWIDAAARLGIRVERSAEAYASWNGEGTLFLAAPGEFDTDDSLAQLVLHELCHALVSGAGGRTKIDWGLDNTSERDLVLEHACHRLQAALTRPYGLRDFFAVTTEHRAYWDALPDDPLAPSDDPALSLARRAHAEASTPPWSDVLWDALSTTARLAAIARCVAPPDSLWQTTRSMHASGFLAHLSSDLACSGCAWSYPKRGKLGCRQADRAGSADLRLPLDAAACERWEPLLSLESCADCGACCREGFDRVEVAPRDAVRRRHPELVALDAWGEFLPRPEGRCVALEGGSGAPYRCRVYADRPRSCAQFAVAGAACLEARRRVGLSR